MSRSTCSNDQDQVRLVWDQTHQVQMRSMSVQAQSDGESSRSRLDWPGALRRASSHAKTLHSCPVQDSSIEQMAITAAQAAERARLLGVATADRGARFVLHRVLAIRPLILTSRRFVLRV